MKRPLDRFNIGLSNLPLQVGYRRSDPSGGHALAAVITEVAAIARDTSVQAKALAQRQAARAAAADRMHHPRGETGAGPLDPVPPDRGPLDPVPPDADPADRSLAAPDPVAARTVSPGLPSPAFRGRGMAGQTAATPSARGRTGESVGDDPDDSDDPDDADDPDRPADPDALGRDGVAAVGPHRSALDLARLDRLALAHLLQSWVLRRHPQQAPPGGDWRNWLILGGRGAGKTRAGAEWVHGLASAGRRSDLRIALVAETLGDAREVMIDGLSGIVRIARHRRPELEISRRRLVWPNGAVAQIFSSEDPDSLRGPQFHYAWCDEVAKWKHADATWDMLQFALRLGAAPRQVITTTPRPVPLLTRLLADPGTRLSRLTTTGNAAHLAPGFIAALNARYGGTRLGRQELEGELIADREDALWRRDRLEALVQRQSEPLGRIVIGVDPPAGAGPASVCGIVVAGLDRLGRAVVLADCSVTGESPAGWAAAVQRAFRRFEADRVVAEVNQGGAMVEALLKGAEAHLPIRQVRATRGKFLRAEPVAALYEQGRVLHAARFPALEDQMCDFGPDGLSGGRSPDRLDALVWAITALLLDGPGEPRIRSL